MKRAWIFHSSILLLLISLIIISSHALATRPHSQTVVNGGYGRYYGKSLCSNPQFTCIKVNPRTTWATLFPNPHDRDVVKRLNRVSLQTVSRPWIVVPKNLRHTNVMALSPFPQQLTPTGQKFVIVNLNYQAWAAYDETSKLVRWGPASGGKGYCPDIHSKCNTITGHFRIYRKQGPECISSRFPVETHGGAPMPYCMHFHTGFALHGAPVLPGYNASHGCVRLFVEDAQWLNLDFTHIGTPVIVTR